VKKTNEDIQPENRDQFNYFNYFTEVEEEFVRRRGKPLFISPLDWALVESWKNAGIPLHVVLRAINEAFDAYDARQRKYRKVNSIFYCEQAVETMFADYRTSQVGASAFDTLPQGQATEDRGRLHQEEEASVFSKETLLAFLDRSYQDLAFAESLSMQQQRTGIVETIKRARKRLLSISEEIESATQVNEQALEHDLDAIDRMILKSIKDSLDPGQRQAIEAEAESHLKSYRQKMDKKIFEQTLQNFISRRLREIYRIPRMSLFYI
jgi:hypothetical protein